MPDRVDANVAGLWRTPGLIPTLVAVFAAFGGWSLLLPVIPQAILDDGRGTGLAGAYTGVFMAATVLTQTQTPRMLRRFGYGATMFASGLLLGLPTFLHLLGTDAALVLALAVVRGMGFGALTVAESALIAELVPKKYLGQATGALGLAVGFGQMLGLPAGLVIAQIMGGYAWVYVLGGVVSLIGSAMALLIPRLKASPKPARVSGTRAPLSGGTAPTWKLVAVPAIAMGATAMAYGGVTAFLSPAAAEVDAASGSIAAGLALSVLGGSAMVFRYIAGIVADRVGGAGSLLTGAMVTSVVGLAAIAGLLLAGASAWWLLAAAVLYGAGFGIVQNEALLLMFVRLPRERTAEASAYWNMSFDSGTGIGSFVLGAVATAAVYPYPTVFAVAAALMGAGLVAVVLDRAIGVRRGRVARRRR